MKKLVLLITFLVVIALLGWLAWWALGNSKQEMTEPAPVVPGKDIKLYMIALEDNGRSGEVIGCDDGVVEVTRSVSGSDAMTDAYTELFTLHDQYYGGSGLYNALWQSSLTLNSASVVGNVAHIEASGTIVQAGECDKPRIKAQLEKPALQFPGVTSVQVKINSQPLDTILSSQ